jgi:hypothetical protein
MFLDVVARKRIHGAGVSTLKEDVKTFAKPSTKVLICRSTSDEASALLVSLAFVSWILTVIWGVVSRFAEIVPPRLRSKITTLCLVILSLTYIGYLTGLFNFADESLTGTAEYHFLFVALLTPWSFLIAANLPWLVTLASLFPFTCTCWLCARFFGFRCSFWDAIEWRFSAEATPPEGPWRYFTVAPSDESLSSIQYAKGRGPMHSNPFTDPQNISLLVNWMKIEWLNRKDGTGAPDLQ